MQTSARISTLLLLLLPCLLMLTPATQARGPVKVGCLNYGHSCLGAHGKRGSWPPSAPRPPTAGLLAPFLPGLATQRSPARSWQDKLITQHRQHHQQEEEQQQQQQQQHQVFPSVYGDVTFARLPAALPAPVQPAAPALDDDDDMLYYSTYDDDYADHRAKRSVDEKNDEIEATPSDATLSCLLFSRRC